jgi:hypothetical protein
MAISLCEEFMAIDGPSLDLGQCVQRSTSEENGHHKFHLSLKSSAGTISLYSESKHLFSVEGASAFVEMEGTWYRITVQ